jgi:hypothetical protein
MILTWPPTVPVDASRLLVCGEQLYVDRERVYSVLSELNPVLVIHGAAPGADTLADDWALSRGVPVLRFHANWTGYARRMAGFARNVKMLHEGRPTAVAAFPGRAGTGNMVRQALEAGVTVVRIRG